MTVQRCYRHSVTFPLLVVTKNYRGKQCNCPSMGILAFFQFLKSIGYVFQKPDGFVIKFSAPVAAYMKFHGAILCVSSPPLGKGGLITLLVSFCNSGGWRRRDIVQNSAKKYFRHRMSFIDKFLLSSAYRMDQIGMGCSGCEINLFFINW